MHFFSQSVLPQWSLLLVLIMAVGLFLTWLIPFLIFLLPTVVFLLFDLILERIFRRFMSEEDFKAGGGK